MEAKHGVTFKDYALANANLANGMPIDKICEVLGVEEPVWAEVSEYFVNNMGQLDPGGEEMMFFSTVFTNPKQGKFENVEGAAGGVEDVLAKYPEWSDFIKMEKYMGAVSEVGIDIDFDKEFDISITQYSQLGGHWSAFYNEKVVNRVDGDAEASRIFALADELRDKWEAHYKEIYKGQGADISSDIDF